jgi:hypothetical protein
MNGEDTVTVYFKLRKTQTYLTFGGHNLEISMLQEKLYPTSGKKFCLPLSKY